MRKLLARLLGPKVAIVAAAPEVTPDQMLAVIDCWLKLRGWQKKGPGDFAWFRPDDDTEGFTLLGALMRELPLNAYGYIQSPYFGHAEKPR